MATTDGKAAIPETAARETVRYLVRRYGDVVENSRDFEAALMAPLPLFLWTHTGRISPAELRAILTADGLGPEPLPWHPSAFRLGPDATRVGTHWAYHAGLFHIQEASSMIPPLLAPPGPEDRILDLCAAPGNKMAQYALTAGDRATVVANDIVCDRLRAARSVIDRLGLSNICMTCRDGANYPREAGEFDIALADAPCGCEGTSRRYPDLTRKLGEPSDRRTHRQGLLLEQAIRRCRVGGRIVYATCTYAPEENEAVVDDLLRRHEGRLRMVPARLEGFRSAPGLDSWRGRRFHPDLGLARRVWPHLNDTGGFFVAVLEKIDLISWNYKALPATGDAGFAAEAGDGQIPLDDARAGEYLADIGASFGIPPEAFASVRLFLKPKRAVYAVSRHLRPPAFPGRSMGFPLVRIGMRHDKLTTAATAAFGRAARRRVLPLTPEQCAAYLARQTGPLSPDQCAGQEPGFVLVTRNGHPLGIGVLDPEGCRLASLFPKHHAVG